MKWPLPVVKYVLLMMKFLNLHCSLLHLYLTNRPIMMKELILPNSGTELLKVRPSDIVYIEAEGNYCSMHLSGGFRQQLWFNRQKFIAIINEQMKAERPTFVVVGRSFIINIDYIYLINPIQGDLILFDSSNPAQIKLHASQEALNRLKTELTYRIK